MKTSANIATYKPRVDSRSLHRMIESIYNQYDIIRIYFNEYDKAPTLPDPDNKIQKIVSRVNLTDNGKFAGLDSIMYHEFYHTLDDDLIYPPDYRERTNKAIEEFGCIVSYHGRQLLGTGRNYYRGHKCLRCLDTVHGNQIVDVCGTGVTAFDTRYFHPRGLASHELQRMSDLIFSLEAARQQKQIGVIQHEVGWIKAINNKETIFETENKGTLENQNRLADEIYTLNHK